MIMHRAVSSLLMISLLGSSAAALTACNKVMRDLRHFPEIFNPAVNVTEYNYAAADDLAGQARNDLSLNNKIGMGVLYPTNLNPDEKTPPFGKVAVDQMATRLISLGYKVVDIAGPFDAAMRETEGGWIGRGQAAGADVMVTGSYTVSEYDILVNARMIRLKDNQLLAATDYRLPLGTDTYKLLNRDPFQAVKVPPVNNPDTTPPGTPLPSRDLPTKIIN